MFPFSKLCFCSKLPFSVFPIVYEIDELFRVYSIKSFYEKPKGDGLWINGGFMVCEPEVFNYIENDSTIWEQHSMPKLANDGKLSSFKHTGFWRPMDTLQDKYKLNELWESNKAAWKIWE